MESVAGIAVADLGLSGLLALTVLLILGGGLVPRRQYRSALAEKDQQIAEHRADKVAQRQIIDEQAMQISLLIPKIELSVHIADALKKLGEGEGS
ncbi:hypothetical protein [Rhodococcus artemisiae]|uniref:Uncharacterized protein n=1 Tax=Rhodococcus artemisiae TaxID=714159 RepID=A0ABU7LBU0_9NOCA|nr:hypothetical protein [Rhodococcus artemisiae]MEE2058984.1 hypothetical protein [Rhodococcus artemisiae]